MEANGAIGQNTNKTVPRNGYRFYFSVGKIAAFRYSEPKFSQYYNIKKNHSQNATTKVL